MSFKRITDDQIAGNPNSFYRGCAGKKKFPSLRIARGVARAMKDEFIKAYRCKFCSGIHLGHSKEK